VKACRPDLNRTVLRTQSSQAARKMLMKLTPGPHTATGRNGQSVCRDPIVYTFFK